MKAVERAARLAKAVQNAWAHKGVFFVLFITVLFLSFSALMWFGLVPDGDSAAPVGAASDDEPLVALTTVSQSPDASAAFATGELPVKISIPSIGVSATIKNPTTTNIETLDNDLLSGAVRYPTSALLGQENGNVILFGHSSYLPIVNNLAYKTFDGIQNLKVGDTITVYSSERAYTYAVDSVQKENAESAAIPLSVTGERLTLSTCNSFATKSDRFVVSATLVDSHSLGS